MPTLKSVWNVLERDESGSLVTPTESYYGWDSSVLDDDFETEQEAIDAVIEFYETRNKIKGGTFDLNFSFSSLVIVRGFVKSCE